MRTIIFLILLLIFGFKILTNSDVSDSANFIITVKDANDNNIPGALVRIKLGSNTQQAYTVASGKVIFIVSQTGNYTLCGSKNNLSDVEYFNISSIPPSNHYADLTIISSGELCPIGD